MRRAAVVLAFGMAVASWLPAQEPAAGAENRQEAEQHDPWIWWKWANFAILAAGLGFLIAKNAPAFFEARSKEILQGIADGTKALKEAQARSATVELRLAGIQKEIDNLRSDARAEMAAEEQNIQRQTEKHLQRLQEQSAQEIALMTRGSRDELRKYSADLALDLAEQRIRVRMNKETQDGLVDGFVKDLRSQPPAGVRA